MKRFFSSQRNFQAIYLAIYLIVFLLPLVAQSEPAVDAGSVGEGIHLFLPAGMKADNLPASVALVRPLPPPVPVSTNDWPLHPEFSRTDDGKTRVILDAPAGTSFYGEGEVTGPLRRNGTDTILWNTDNGGYVRDKGRRLYQSHPWVMGVRPDGTAFGFLADTTWHAEIKLGETRLDFISDGPAFPVLLIERPSPQEVVKTLAKLVGTMPLPPRWALGYHQCRYSYVPDARVRQIADEFRARKIPCDVIWMDIDYMDGYRTFTFDPKRFPDPRATNDYLHQHDFHSVWMIDLGIKAEKGYSVYDSGTAADAWIKDAGGENPFVGKVWPGDCVFVDYTSPAASAWWSGLYKDFMAQGVDGVWNDMNEPAVFTNPDPTMDIRARHRGGGGLPAGTEAQYHNVFGMLEVRATREGIQAANPDKRPFVLSRAGYLGSHRYAATWTGDNVSKWEHLKTSVPMSLNLGLSGQPMSGPDIGGFQGVATPELWAHWAAVGAFLPFCRGHSDSGTPGKEPWAFGQETEAAVRTALERRYRLLPYLYTLFHESSLDGLPVIRPVFFADPKDVSLRSEQEAFLVGADLLVIPKWAKEPHLPKGIWREASLPSDTVMGKEYQPELRVRGGAIVPLGKIIQSTNEESLDPLTLLVCLDADGKAEGGLYEDSGEGYGYRDGDYLLTTYRAERRSDGVVTVSVEATDGKRARPAKRPAVVEVLTAEGSLHGAGLDGEPIKVTAELSK